MDKKVTFDEIRAIQKENAEGMKELRETQKAHAAQMKADREQREADWAKTVAQIKADREQWEADLKASREATKATLEKERALQRALQEKYAAASDKRSEEADKRGAALDKRIKEISEELGGMGSSNGKYAEEYFADAMKEKMVFAGQHFDEIATDLNAKHGKLQDQFDVVLYNGESVAIIEIKYRARTEDLEQMVNKKLANFRALFPYYKDYKVYLGLGSMSFNKHVYAKAQELGIGLLKQKGETVEAEPGFVKAY
jgi:hypothetical protein